MSSSSLQDSSSLEEPQPYVDLFGIAKLDDMTSEQFASIPCKSGMEPRVIDTPKKKKTYLQVLVESHSCDNSEPSLLFNEDFSVRNQSKSYKEDIKKEFDHFVKLYCMYIGNNSSNFDERLNKLIEDKSSLVKSLQVRFITSI
jgi:hypothetical protein